MITSQMERNKPELYYTISSKKKLKVCVFNFSFVKSMLIVPIKTCMDDIFFVSQY